MKTENFTLMQLPPDNEPHDDEFPAELILTVKDPYRAMEEAVERAGWWEDGEQIPDRHTFPSHADLRKLLTDSCIALIHSLQQEAAESVSALADRLDRNQSDVSQDLEILADAGIVHFRDGPGRAKQSFIPYKHVRIDAELTTPAE